MTEQHVRLLLVDDEKSIRVPLQKSLVDSFGYQVCAVASGTEAITLVRDQGEQFDVALLDEMLLDGPDGIETMKVLKTLDPGLEAIIFTGWGAESKQRALRAGAFRYLEKPVDFDELAIMIRTAAQQVRLRELGRAIFTIHERERVLEIILGAASSLSLADDAAIVIRDPEIGQLYIHPQASPSQREWRRHYRDRWLSDEIISSGQLVWVPDTREETGLSPEVVRAGIRSFLGLPIPGEGANLGVIYVYSYRDGRFEDWGTVSVLQTLAGQAGMALSNVHAFRQVRTHAGYMESLVEAGQGLTRSVDPVEQLDLVWAFVRRQLDVSTFFVALYDAATGTISFPMAYEQGELQSIPERIIGDNRSGWGASGYVVRTGDELSWSTLEEEEAVCAALDIRGIRHGQLPEEQSCFYLPLKLGSLVLGVVSIQSKAPHAFSPILLDAFRALGSQLAVALQNSRLFQQTRRRADEMSTLSQVVLEIGRELTRGELLQVIVRQAISLLEAEGGAIYLVDPSGRHFRLETLVGLTTTLEARLIPRDQGLTGEILQTGAPRAVIDYRHWPGRLEMLDDLELTAAAGAPIRIGERIRGSLTLYDTRPDRRFDEAACKLLQQLADHAGLALQKADLMEKLRGIQRLSATVTSSLEYEEVLTHACQAAVELFEVEHSGLVLFEPNGEGGIVRGEYPARVGTLGTHIPVRGILAEEQVLRHGKTLQYADVSEARSELGRVCDILERFGVRSLLIVPIIYQGQVLGSFSLDTLTHRRTFDAAEAELCKAFADHVAVAVSNARFYREAQDRINELEHMRQAAETLAGADGLHQVLTQIARSARTVLGADSATIWSYDEGRRQFVPEESVFDGTHVQEFERYRKLEPKPGGTAHTVMQRGWLGVEDIWDPKCWDFEAGPSTHDLLRSIGASSFQGIALRVAGVNLGVLYVNYSRRQQFGPAQRRTLETFAGHASLALNNARLLAQLKRTREAAQAIAGTTVQEDLRQTLSTIARHTRQVLRADAVTVYAYDEDRAAFYEWATDCDWLRDPRASCPPDRLPGSSTTQRILNLSDPPYHVVVDNELVLDPVLSGHYVRQEGMCAAFAGQVRIGERRVGVLFVNYRSPHHFAPDELETIQLFVHQAALAIRNAQLYRRAQDRARAVESLYRAGQVITGSLSLDEVLNRIVEQAWRLVGPEGQREARFSNLALRDGEWLRFVAAYPPQHLTQLKATPGDMRLDRQKPMGISGRVLISGVAERVGDVGRDPDYIAYDRETRSEMVVPLIAGGEAIGVINLEHPDRDAFGSEDLQVLESLAAQATIAIQNARMYQDLHEAQGVIGARTALAWMGMTSSAWRHSVNNLAQIIKEQSQLLRNMWQEEERHPSNVSVPKRIDAIERLAGEIQEKPITPPLSADEGTQWVALTPLVEERVQQLRHASAYQDITLLTDTQLEESASVWASREWLRRAIDMLADNSARAVADRPCREIVVGTRPGKRGGAEIWVADTGPGIPPDVVDHIGHDLIRKAEDTQGMGMGLLMAQTIVQTYGGELGVDQTGPEGTTMVLWLPLQPRQEE